MLLSPRTSLVRTYRQNGFVAVLEILTARLIAGLRMTQGVRLLHAAARLQSFHHFVVLVTTAKRCVNVLAQRGQSPLHRGGLVCANIAIEGMLIGDTPHPPLRGPRDACVASSTLSQRDNSSHRWGRLGLCEHYKQAAVLCHPERANRGESSGSRREQEASGAV